MRAARRNFSETSIFFFLRELDAKYAGSWRWTLSFSDLNAMLTRSTLSDVVKYVQRTLADCTQFLCAGRPDFRKFCKIFARFLRKICIISTLDSRVIFHWNACRLGDELQRSSALRATTLAEFTQLLRARRAEKFRGLCNSFARVGRKFCVIPTRDAFLFESECNTDSINSQRRCEVCAAHAGRVHAIFVRGACRISGNFANFSRDFCAKFASSRRWTRALLIILQ